MKKRLIKYAETPQVTALEYEELFDLERHPEKKTEYERLAFARRNSHEFELLSSKSAAKNRRQKR